MFVGLHHLKYHLGSLPKTHPDYLLITKDSPGLSAHFSRLTQTICSFLKTHPDYLLISQDSPRLSAHYSRLTQTVRSASFSILRGFTFILKSVHNICQINRSPCKRHAIFSQAAAVISSVRTSLIFVLQSQKKTADVLNQYLSSFVFFYKTQRIFRDESWRSKFSVTIFTMKSVLMVLIPNTTGVLKNGNTQT